MDKLVINQSMGLSGEIRISGAKNAALPIICASILTHESLELHNTPDLKDIQTLIQLLKGMGVVAHLDKNKLILNASNLNQFTAPYELVKTMRASILVLGPLLAKFGEAIVSLPGGCAIGARPVDQHIKGLELMGANITIENGYIKAWAKELVGAHIIMDVVTVTGTENLLMAATLARGTTVLENCAKEPEVSDLALMLISMGAKIEGIGTDKLTIHGVKSLHGTTHAIIADRIECGTYAIAAVMTQSNLSLTHTRPDTMYAILDKLTQAGAMIDIDEQNHHIHIAMHKRATAVDIKTLPYPNFPTDMQAQFVALNTIANGVSTITETIFENRFMHVPELSRMGAHIEVNGHIAIINGVEQLTGATVMATDLRASASLVLAGLAATGTTNVERVYHLDRGYEHLEKKLQSVGALIKRI